MTKFFKKILKQNLTIQLHLNISIIYVETLSYILTDKGALMCHVMF